MTFDNREDAGHQLASALRRFRGRDVVVLALPRGGIITGAAVARTLGTPLDVLLVRKIGHPAYSEYAIGAVAENQPAIYNQDETATLDGQWLDQAEASARATIRHRRDYYYPPGFRRPRLSGKTAIIVDDGIATGLTMKAAVLAVRHQKPARIVVAVPVASRESVDMLEDLADEVIILDRPENFAGAVGAHYREFEQVDDEEVRRRLRELQNVPVIMPEPAGSRR